MAALETTSGDIVLYTKAPILRNSTTKYVFRSTDSDVTVWSETLGTPDRTPTMEEQGWSVELEHKPRPGWQNYAQQIAPQRKGGKKQRSKYLRKRSKD